MTCDHSKELYDEEGRWLGSWVKEETKSGVRVVCESCGKFYGYIAKGRADADRSVQE